MVLEFETSLTEFAFSCCWVIAMAEIWQLAIVWLQKLNVFSPGCPALLPTATVYDLALALQDGVILCLAANKLKKNVIKKFHENPQKLFMKKENINSFLDAMPSFGLKPSDLFHADHLYYASDFAKVVSTLSLLSKSSISAGQYKPFPESAGPTRVKLDDDTYACLEDLVGQSISFGGKGFSSGESEQSYEHIEKTIVKDVGMEDIYSALVEKGVSKSPNEESVYAFSSPDGKRDLVLKEVYDTEKNYVKVLNVIIDNFQKDFLMAPPKIISREMSKTIFSNVADLRAAHISLIQDLDRAMVSTNTGRIISVPFSTAVKNGFRAYAAYCCDIPDSLAKLKELGEKEASAKLMEQALRDSKQKFPLKDLLNVPMQRILKYPLLLKELDKHTPDGHPDKKGLANAHQDIQELAMYINQKKKNQDDYKYISQSLKKYPKSGRPLIEFGPMLKDGDFMHSVVEAKNDMKQRFVFLFGQALILCKSSGVFWNFKQTIELCEDHVLVELTETKPSDQNGKYAYMWQLKRQNDHGPTHQFATKSLPQKKQWMDQMNLLISQLSTTKPQAPSRAKQDISISGGSTRRPTPAAGGGKNYEQWDVGPPSAKSPTPSGKSYEDWTVGGPPAAAAVADDPSEQLVAGGEENWFAGKMDRPTADGLLASVPDGTYLVRESDSRPGDYSLSIKYSIVKHIKINRRGARYDLAPDSKSFLTIQEVVGHFQAHSLNRHFPGMETTLKIPFKAAAARMAGAGAALAPKILGRARARFDYLARAVDELSFQKGNEIIILSKTSVDEGWMKGRLADGTEGVFPANYITTLT